MYTGFWWENRKGRYHYKDLDVDVRIMDPRGIGCGGMDRILLTQKQGQAASSCDHENEVSASIKFWEILEYLRDWWLLKNSAPWSS
jgi:hypothetical protein